MGESYKDQQIGKDSFGNTIFKPARKRRGIATLEEYVKCFHVCWSHTTFKQRQGRTNHVWEPLAWWHKAIPNTPCRYTVFKLCEECCGFPYTVSRKEKLKHLPQHTREAILRYVKEHFNK